MDYLNSNSEREYRQWGQHLTSYEGGIIKSLRRQGKSYRAIAKVVRSSPSTVYYEIKPGTPAISRRKTFSLSKLLDMLKKYTKPSTVFKTIAAGNGTEFAALSVYRKYGTKIYFAYPYSSWERAQNEGMNRDLRKYFPKKMSFDNISNEDVQQCLIQHNSMPRKVLNYKTLRSYLMISWTISMLYKKCSIWYCNFNMSELYKIRKKIWNLHG